MELPSLPTEAANRSKSAQRVAGCKLEVKRWLVLSARVSPRFGQIYKDKLAKLANEVAQYQ